MNRLYVVEGMPTLTGAIADHRWALRSSRIADYARAVAPELGLDVLSGNPLRPAVAIPAVVGDLPRSRGPRSRGKGPFDHLFLHALAREQSPPLAGGGARLFLARHTLCAHAGRPSHPFLGADYRRRLAPLALRRGAVT